jgi:hypothetical protein
MATKLCKDCVHFKRSDVDPKQERFHQCGRTVGLSRVTGTPRVHDWDYCSIQRKEGGLFQYVFNICGKRGRFFQPK